MFKLSRVTRFHRTFYSILSNRQSSSVAGKPKQVTPCEKASETFEDLMNRREAEVKCSIIVKVDSLDVSSNVYNYCKQFGEIKNAYAYSIRNERNFLLLEYEDEESVTEAFKYCGYPIDATPWANQYLSLRKSALNETNSQEAPIQFSHVQEPSVVNILKNAKSINEQALLLYEHTCINDLLTRLRFMGANQVTRILNFFMPIIFPNAKVYPFGSTLSGFGKFGSDLDAALRFDSVEKTRGGNSPLKFLNNVYHTEDDFKSSTVRFIPNARVPIVTYYDTNIPCSVDLSINNLNGFSDTQLMYTLGALDARVRPFIFLVRRWAREFQIVRHGPGDRFTNFQISYIALSFLQNLSEPIIPSYEEMTRMTNKSKNSLYILDLNQIHFQSKNTSNVIELFEQFLEYYSTFEFETRTVTLRTTEPVEKSSVTPLYLENIFNSDQACGDNISANELRTLQIMMKETLDEMDHMAKEPDGSSEWGGAC